METIDDINARMFELYLELKKLGILKYKRDFANACGLPEQNLYNIKQGRNNFTIVHIMNVCKFYGINMNWIVKAESNLFLKPQNSKQTVNKIDIKTAI